MVLIAILAAGESRRMGTPKLCLPWRGTTILGHLLGQWREAGGGRARILVVHPQDPASPVVTELERFVLLGVQGIATRAPERGMMGSVVTAAGVAAADASLTHLVIALGDQPHLHPLTLIALLIACRNPAHREKIIRVVFQGKPGHPFALPAALLPALSASPCATLRDFLGLQGTPVHDLTCDDSGVLLDLDTPDDYARAHPCVE